MYHVIDLSNRSNPEQRRGEVVWTGQSDDPYNSDNIYIDLLVG
jgi:hypothetical protein